MLAPHFNSMSLKGKIPLASSVLELKYLIGNMHHVIFCSLLTSFISNTAFPSHFMKSLSNSIVNNLIYLYTSHLNLFLNLSKTSKRKIWKLYFILHITSIKEFSTLCLVLKYKEESIAKHKFDDLWKV